MTNTTVNGSSYPNVCGSLNCIFTRAERDLIIVSMFSIAVISLAGNIPILIAILFSPKRRNSSNLSTVNLVVSDLLMTIFCIPFVTLDLYVFDAWVFGPAMCRLVTFAQNTAVHASLLNLLTITCEKFLAVRFPFHLRLRKKLVCHFMPVAWIIAIAESSFYVQFKKLVQFDDEDTFYCTENWPDMGTYKKAQIVKFLLFFGPLAMIILLHSITLYTLHRGRNTFQLPLNRSERDSFRKVARKQRRQRKAVKIILVTLISIIVCWGPHYIFAVILTCGYRFSIRSINIGYAVGVWLLFCHCSVFPFIYFFFTQKGKETIEVCSLCLRTCRMSRNGSNTASLLIDASNTHGSSFRGTLRSSLRRVSTGLNETRL